MKRLNLSSIRIDGETQSRQQLNQEKVHEYAEQMREQVEFPPITVFHDGSDYWLSSGFHRYFATKEIGNDSIQCEVMQGTARDAKLYSFGANKHGAPHTPEDNRRIVAELIKDEEWGKWSNTQIAKHIGVSGMTVGRILNSLGAKPKEEVKYIKNGKQVVMKVNKEAKKPNIIKMDNHNTVIGAVQQSDKVQELSDTVVHLDEENARLKDIIAAKRWDASEIEVEDIHDTVKELREQVRILEIDNKALRESRDMYQNRNAELIRQVKSLTKAK
jgi:hypothetical protein